jgi:hypothetical protein
VIRSLDINQQKFYSYHSPKNNNGYRNGFYWHFCAYFCACSITWVINQGDQRWRDGGERRHPIIMNIVYSCTFSRAFGKNLIHYRDAALPVSGVIAIARECAGGQTLSDRRQIFSSRPRNGDGKNEGELASQLAQNHKDSSRPLALVLFG